jgi:hypothetical protein
MRNEHPTYLGVRIPEGDDILEDAWRADGLEALPPAGEVLSVRSKTVYRRCGRVG